MLITTLLISLLSQPVLAETPLQSLLGDWDLGPNSAAFRITQRDEQSIFVQNCNRDTLLNSHICSAGSILYFSFSQSAGGFIHDEASGEHLHAVIQIDSHNPSVIYYTFKSDAGSGELIGKKL